MRRVYHRWEKWECIGMYTTKCGLPIEEAKQQYAGFLRNLPRFNRAMKRVANEWPISCEQFLTNPSINRVAWLGQSSMFIETGVPRCFRGGFVLLTLEERARANRAAEIFLQRWIREHAASGR